MTDIAHQLSPDGMIRVEMETTEWRNGWWLYSPRIVSVSTGAVLIDLTNSDWDVTIDFPGPCRVRLNVQRAHYGGDAAIDLDLASGRYTIIREAGIREAGIREAGHGAAARVAREGPIEDAREAIEASARRSAAFRRAAAGQAPLVEPIAPNPWAAWRGGLAIFAGAAVVLAGVAVWASHAERHRSGDPRPVPTFTPMPDARPAADFRMRESDCSSQSPSCPNADAGS